tara:strand:+ start:277 stop:378 length:102 start_codon:yes stop_codon:yes gene_type:complete
MCKFHQSLIQICKKVGFAAEIIKGVLGKGMKKL